VAKIELDFFFPHSVDKVWAALTVPEDLGAWYMRPEAYQPVVGTKFRLHSRPNPFFSGIAYGEVLSVDAPQQLRWSLADRDGVPTTVTLTWTLRAEGSGTRLSLLQDGLTGVRGQMTKLFMTAGWKRLLGARLPALLASR
jgi:uncharacterized protein YndB with AHSA1/START domain